MEKLKSYLNKEQKKTFLDIGTGGGNFIHLIDSIYPDYEKMMGIDTFDRAIEMAEKHFADNDRVTFEVMDAYKMKYPDNSIDVVMLSNSLHHLKDINEMLLEMRRILKNDGFIIINEMLADNLDAMQESHKMLHHFAAEIDRLHGDTHNETFTKKEIEKHLTTQTKLKILESWNMNVPRRKENSKEELEHILELLERVSSRFPEEKVEELTIKKENIKNYILKNGYDGCTSMITILTK